jgi:DNA-binding NarL/FixJ family response regulator
VAGLIDVLIIDDHPVVSEGLTVALGADPELRVVTVAATLAEARAALAEHRPRVALVDIRLPDGSGLGLIDPSSPTAWIVLSSFGTPQHIDAARRLGASGFFLKSSPTRDIIDGIKRVVAGGTAFDPEIVRRETVSGRWRPLSARERDIVSHVVQGRSNDEIGRELGIARRTVEAHLVRLYERYDCRSRAELSARAEREGWLDVPPS